MRANYKRPKLLLLWDRMGDYHRARVKATSKLFEEESVFSADLIGQDHTYFWANSESSNHITLSNTTLENLNHFKAFKRFKEVVNQHQITHVCIPGYGRFVYILILLWCRTHSIKAILFAESWYPNMAIVDWLKGIMLNLTVSWYFVSGKRAAQHFKLRLKVKASKIIQGYSVIDNQHFNVEKDNKGNPPILLCVARFAPEKNLAMLIEAFQKSELHQLWQLKIIGGGELNQELQELISVQDKIKLHEWVSYEMLPQFYKEASCFILPSQFEPWGLVVNEAMAASLPIILSVNIGALPDLLDESMNGWSFALDIDSLLDVLNKLHQTPEFQLLKMGTHSRKIVEYYSCQTWANKILNCIFE